jgi:hypothetical protein
MNAPTYTDIQGWTELDALKNAPEAKAQRMAAIAVSGFKRITGQTDFAAIPADDEPIVNQAVTGLAEMAVNQSSAEYLETLSDWDLIQSFNAGNYSETHRSPDDARKARMLVAWPWLSDLLWGLLTPEKYDYWVSFFGGQNAPAFAVTEVDWSPDGAIGGSYNPAYYGGA